MTPQEKRLLLATARLFQKDLSERVIRGLVSEETRADLEELDQAVASFSGDADLEPLTMGGDADELLEVIFRRRPFDALLHPDGEFTVSTLAIPQFAIAKTPHQANAQAVAVGLNFAAHARDILSELDSIVPPTIEPEKPLLDRVKALLDLHAEAVACLRQAERLYSERGMLASSSECGAWINRTRAAIKELSDFQEAKQ